MVGWWGKGTTDRHLQKTLTQQRVCLGVPLYSATMQDDEDHARYDDDDDEEEEEVCVIVLLFSLCLR